MRKKSRSFVNFLFGFAFFFIFTSTFNCTLVFSEDVAAAGYTTATQQAVYTTETSQNPDPAMNPAPYADFTSLKPVFDEEPLDEEEPLELLRSDVEKIYFEFKSIVAAPPGSGSAGEYAADKAKELCEKCAELCSNINKLIYSVTDRSVKIYGPVLQAMRDVLYLDAVCLKEYAAGNTQHAELWKSLHAKWMSAVEERYAAMQQSAVILR